MSSGGPPLKKPPYQQDFSIPKQMQQAMGLVTFLKEIGPPPESGAGAVPGQEVTMPPEDEPYGLPEEEIPSPDPSDHDPSDQDAHSLWVQQKALMTLVAHIAS